MMEERNTSKQAIGTYIQDLKKLYAEIQILEKVTTDLMRVRSRKKPDTEAEYHRRLEELKKILSSIDSEIHPVPPSAVQATSILRRNMLKFMILAICGIAGYAIGHLCISQFLNMKNIVLGIICAIIAIAFALLVVPLDLRSKSIYEKEEYEHRFGPNSYWAKHWDQFNKRKEHYEEQLRLHTSQDLQQLLKSERDKEELLELQITYNNKNIAMLQQQIENYYSLNILPPDYRTMDCIITLDHIFRNDLADTVREAILLYEEWVFRGVVIKGMDNIMKMLGNLSSQMQYMQQTLDSIDAGVSSICSDLYQVLELQEKQNRTQEQILRETQCSRQAAEAIQQSNERFVWYAEQHRAGLL